MCMLVSMSYGLWCHASGHSPHAHPPNRAYMERTICWVGYPIILPATAPEPSVSRTPQEVLEVIAHHTRPLTLFVHPYAPQAHTRSADPVAEAKTRNSHSAEVRERQRRYGRAAMARAPA